MINEKPVSPERGVEVVFVRFDPALEMVSGEKIHAIPRWSDGVLALSRLSTSFSAQTPAQRFDRLGDTHAVRKHFRRANQGQHLEN